MSQVFSGDSVNMPLATTITTTTEAVGAVGNNLNPPFGNAKAMVFGYVVVSCGTGTTSLVVRIRRNTGAENVVVTVTSTINVTAGNTVGLPIMGADVIPDGRSVQYVLTVQQTAASGNGQILQSTVAAILISG